MPMPMIMPYSPTPALALALLGVFGLAITPVVHSGPTIDDINVSCANVMLPEPCLDVLLTNLDVRTPAVNGVPEMSVQVAAKIARDADGFAGAEMVKIPHPSKCIMNCVDDIGIVAKKLDGLPMAAIQAGGEAEVLSFIEGFKRRCGEDCPMKAEISEDERVTLEKFNTVMKVLSVTQELFMTKKQ
ncbi:unnamed protein product [Alopecurus aequalis]